MTSQPEKPPGPLELLFAAMVRDRWEPIYEDTLFEKGVHVGYRHKNTGMKYTISEALAFFIASDGETPLPF